MPGLQKGKKHKPGAGRPRLSAAQTVRVTVTLPAPEAARLRELGGGNASAGVRRLLEQDVAARGLDAAFSEFGAEPAYIHEAASRLHEALHRPDSRRLMRDNGTYEAQGNA